MHQVCQELCDTYIWIHFVWKISCCCKCDGPWSVCIGNRIWATDKEREGFAYKYQMQFCRITLLQKSDCRIAPCKSLWKSPKVIWDEANWTPITRPIWYHSIKLSGQKEVEKSGRRRKEQEVVEEDTHRFNLTSSIRGMYQKGMANY